MRQGMLPKMARGTTGTVQAGDGTELFYRRWPGASGGLALSKVEGPALSKAEGTVLLLIHGVGEHSGRYRFPVSFFHPLGYTLYAYDQRGHGLSSGPRAYAERFARLIGDLDRILRLVREREGDKRVVLVGHSFGAQVALTYGARHPKKVAAVITSAANLRLKMPVPWLKKQAGLLIARYLPRFTMPAGLNPEHLSHDPQVVADYVRDPRVNKQITVRLAAEMFANQDEMLRMARQFRLPCLLLHGGDDPISDPEGTRDFFEATASKDKELKIYPGLYHELFNEVDRGEVFRDMENWLQEHHFSER